MSNAPRPPAFPVPRLGLTLVFGLKVGLGLSFGGALACDSGAKDGEADKNRQAAADAMLGGDSKHDKARVEDEERRKKSFEERKAKEEAEAAASLALIEKVMGLPDPMPQDLNEACTQMLPAWEAYVKNTNVNDDGAILAFYDNKKTLLGERKTKCMRLGSLKAAACSTVALTAAGPDLKDMGLRILSACADKYPGEGGAPPPAPPAE